MRKLSEDRRSPTPSETSEFQVFSIPTSWQPYLSPPIFRTATIKRKQIVRSSQKIIETKNTENYSRRDDYDGLTTSSDEEDSEEYRNPIFPSI